MRNYALAAIALSLCLSACNAPGEGGPSNGNGQNSVAPTGSASPVNGAGTSPNGEAKNGVSQADADLLCAELNKNGNTASCVLKDGQLVIQPK